MRRKFSMTLSVLLLVLLALSGTITAHADSEEEPAGEEVDIGQEVQVNSDGKDGMGTSGDIQKDITTSDTESQQNTSGSTNQSTNTLTAEEQSRANAVQTLVNARNALINAAMANAGNLFGGNGAYYQVGVATVTPSQISDICSAVEKFEASINDSQVPDWMNNSAAYNNTSSSKPHDITIDASVNTLTDEEKETIAEELGDGAVVSNESNTFMPDGFGALANPCFYAIKYDTSSAVPFYRFLYGDNETSAVLAPDEWLQLYCELQKGTVTKSDLIRGGLKTANTWTGMFTQYAGYRSNAMNDFVTTAFIREYKIQKVERDILSEVDYTSDKRQWQIYKYENNTWVKVGEPIETNNPEHEFRTSFHEQGRYKITAQQWGVANKTTSALYAVCEYTFDTGTKNLIRYRETSIDNGIVPGKDNDINRIILSTEKGVEGWYDTGEVKYFNVNDLGEIETEDGITERVG